MDSHQCLCRSHYVFPETWVPVLSVPEHSIIMNNRYLFTLAFMCIHAKLLQLCLTLCNPVDCSQQASVSMGFSGQEYWSRLPCSRKPSVAILKIFIYLAALGLRLWHAGSVIVVHGLSCPMAYGILVPQPGIELASPALEAWSLNHWTTREVLQIIL